MQLTIPQMQALIEFLQGQIKQNEDDALLCDIVRDQRVPSSEQRRAPTVRVQGAIPVTNGVSLDVASRGVPGNGTGWQGAKSIDDWRPPGVDLIDAMLPATPAERAARRGG
jgi:hypothetical protein